MRKEKQEEQDERLRKRECTAVMVSSRLKLSKEY